MVKIRENPEKIKKTENPGPDLPDFARKKKPEKPGSGDVGLIPSIQTKYKKS